MLRYDFHVTEKDYIDFNLHAVKHNVSHKKQLITLRVLLPAMLAVLYLLIGIKNPETRLATGITYLIIAVIWEIVFYPVFTLIVRLNLKSQIKHGSHLYTPDATLIFGENDFSEITPDEELKYTYERIESMAENKGAMYLYLSSLTAIIIPSSAFASSAEREKLIAFLLQKRPELKVASNG